MNTLNGCNTFSTVNGLGNKMMANRTNNTTLLNLPGEIRQHIYSYIFLKPLDHKLKDHQPQHSSEFLPSSPTSHRPQRTGHGANQEYHNRRDVCHKATKALLRTCKQINAEMNMSFQQTKTIVLSSPVQARLDERYEEEYGQIESKIFNTLRWTPLTWIRHVEISMTVNDSGFAEQGGIELHHRMIAVNRTLKKAARFLPNLETITIKLPEEREDHWERNLVGYQSDKNSQWVLCHPYHDPGLGYLDTIIEPKQPFYQYANGLSYGILPEEKWEYTRAVYKSGPSWMGFTFVHELKFVRKASKDTSGWVDGPDEPMEDVSEWEEEEDRVLEDSDEYFFSRLSNDLDMKLEREYEEDSILCD